MTFTTASKWEVWHGSVLERQSMVQQRVPILHFPISHQLHVFRLNRTFSETISLSLSYSLPQQSPTQRIFNLVPIQSVLAIKTTAVPASCYSHLSLTWEVCIASSRRKPCRYPALKLGMASATHQLLKLPCWPLVEKDSLNWSPAMIKGKWESKMLDQP